MNKRKIQEEQNFIQQMQKQGAFEITPCEAHIDLDDTNRFEKLKLTSEHKMQINALMQQIPSAVAAGEMVRAYTVRFPKGLPHTLMSLKQGGVGSQIVVDGKFAGSASFYNMFGHAAILGAFTAVSIVTGQFFLVRINKELHNINRRLNEILQFLYEDKRAELLSEIEFVENVCNNYASIMPHEQQRIATIANLQRAKNIAVKDIIFYMNHLDSVIINNQDEKFATLIGLKNNKFKEMHDGLDFSLKLHLLSTLLEVYCTGNYEIDYIDSLEKNVKYYIEKSDYHINQDYSKLETLLNKNAPKKEKEKSQEHEEELRSIREGFRKEHIDICESLFSQLRASTQSTEYYLKANGDVYYRIPGYT